MLKDYLFLLLLLIVIPHAKKEPKNTFVFVENKMHLLSIFIPLTNKQNRKFFLKDFCPFFAPI
ncbi:hypothetical protein E5A72_07670 [Acinetobacter baumannii ATCC 17978]|nr:hypothetical protein E5A72_07670 [Acinetobacter baumannii ATCC 17978]